MAVITEPRLPDDKKTAAAAIPQPVPLTESTIILKGAPNLADIGGGGDSQGTVGYATSG